LLDEAPEESANIRKTDSKHSRWGTSRQLWKRATL